MRVQYKVFESSTASWESLFDDVANFASAIGPKRLIGISHSEGGQGWMGKGVITVWYWEREPEDV
jgi:hypothetical protein